MGTVISLNAQDSSNVIVPHVSFSIFDVNYGYRVGFQNFYEQLNTTKCFKLGGPLQMIGLRALGEVDFHHSLNKFLILTYSKFISQAITIEDTIKGKIGGFTCGLGWGRTFKSQRLGIYIGFNTGRLRISGQEVIRQKNSFLSPKIGITPIFSLGKFKLHLSLEYAYDISKTSWRRTYFANSNKIVLDNLRQSAITAQIGISYSIH